MPGRNTEIRTEYGFCHFLKCVQPSGRIQAHMTVYLGLSGKSATVEANQDVVKGWGRKLGAGKML